MMDMPGGGEDLEMTAAWHYDDKTKMLGIIIEKINALNEAIRTGNRQIEMVAYDLAQVKEKSKKIKSLNSDLRTQEDRIAQLKYQMQEMHDFKDRIKELETVNIRSQTIFSTITFIVGLLISAGVLTVNYWTNSQE